MSFKGYSQPLPATTELKVFFHLLGYRHNKISKFVKKKLQDDYIHSNLLKYQIIDFNIINTIPFEMKTNNFAS